MSQRFRAVVVVSTLLFAACAAMQQQRSQPVRTDEGEFKNLKVLPQNITHDELIATMRGFARALGTKCNECHVPIPGETNKFDFPNDSKDEKRTARTMILMARNINQNYISKIDHQHDEPGEQHVPVSCWTCHRGHTKPEAPPPPPAEHQARPGA